MLRANLSCKQALEDCHYKGSKDLLCLYLNNNENSELLPARVYAWEEAHRLRRQQYFFLDLSAILIENMPIWAEFSSTPVIKFR
jgi:hypothetical protein